MDLLKMVYVEIVLNVGNYFCTLQLGFWKFLSSISLSFIITKFYKFLRQKWPQKMHLKNVVITYESRILKFKKQQKVLNQKAL